MLQVLVEFQCKVLNTQQTVSIIDIYISGGLHSITSRIATTVRDGGVLLKARPNSAALPQARCPPHYTRRPYGIGHSIPTLLRREKC